MTDSVTEFKLDPLGADFDPGYDVDMDTEVDGDDDMGRLLDDTPVTESDNELPGTQSSFFLEDWRWSHIE